MTRVPLPELDGVPASRLQLPPGPWATVLDALCARFPAVPRAVWQSRFDRGRVLDATGAPLARHAAHRAGLEIGYYREVVDEPRIEDEARIVYADARLVVADKPHGLPVMPAGRFVTQTLLARLRRELGMPHLVPLHRLDRATAGLVMFSADPATRAAYHVLFQERRVVKRYEALAPALTGIDFPHRRCSRMERGEPFFRMREADGPANSETVIEVIERGGATWRYALTPVTGRKHQLRLHMAVLGAPILHDPWYPALQDARPDAPPLQLLARALAFDDPHDGTPRHFVSGRRLGG